MRKKWNKIEEISLSMLLKEIFYIINLLIKNEKVNDFIENTYIKF